ncbi:MAG: MFS transporter [Gemmataceae bacterium]|nr:MFS transporter [Gemmataceae bacterium]
MEQPATPLPAQPARPQGLRDLSAQQWKSGAAAWLGWLFDGLDMHLYVLVAAPFVAHLLGLQDQKDPLVGYYASWIQAAFLVGWAVGGSFFGIVGDRLGRSKALMLTILTYALFTGLSYFAQEWWHLLIFRFLAALGIGGEWAVGASLLSETWPKRWRTWLAAVLQTGVNLGVLLASLALYLLSGFEVQTVFLVGLLPALLVLWIRKAVPETEEWHAARAQKGPAPPGFLDLFRGPVRRTSILTLSVCALTLTAHWAFLFWFPQHLRNLPELAALDDGGKSRLLGIAVALVTVAAIAGNFLASALASRLGYRRTIALLSLAYFASMLITYMEPRGHVALQFGYVAMGLCQGIFALFTMYLPPLFPTLLRTTGAGFCYNIGRIAAGLGTVLFGLFTTVGDYGMALVYASFLFLPAAAIAWFMPDTKDEDSNHGDTVTQRRE